ncbi:hypothetical protein Ait01nite_025630 [Actinoplanes italicus]|uniref:Uncharacterized protein n=1 Tax=Actinoplanes italicus TaxID=113567 RepID=A0A2T0KFB4_9ACTN|nr:hypothetical protein [Actinoplanes italicus]PRX22065.1 hypothetical protein CLV67_105242 [Actinoplanes italicus]GIE29518.1 hypothetical protein Ait01nite_025630 [Actinoplanes italicus]
MSRRNEAATARQERIDAVMARRCGFTPPEASGAALRFAADYARTNLLTYLYDALDAPAADLEVVDHGYDMSSHGRRAGETNRERARRGISLSGNDQERCRAYGMYRAPGTLGDLFDAPTGDTRPTYVSGSGLAAVTWEGMWSDQCLLDGLEHAHTLAELVLADEIATIETIAGLPRADAYPDQALSFGDVPNDVLSLSVDAFRERLEDHDPVFDPEQTVDMTAPLADLPQMLLAARHDWSSTELLALVIAGLHPIERSMPQF